MNDDQETKRAEMMADIVKFLGEIENPKKTGVGKVHTEKANYSYSYLELDEILGLARPVAAENNLAISQPVEVGEDQVKVCTQFLHKNGEIYHSPCICLKAAGTIQLIGGQMTYARRYSLMALLGIAGEDDDAQRVQQAQRAQQAQRPQQKAGGAPASNGRANQNQLTYLHTLCSALGYTTQQKEALKKIFSVETTKDLTKEQASSIIEDLLKEMVADVQGMMEKLELSTAMRKALLQAHGVDLAKPDGRTLQAVRDDLVKQFRSTSPAPPKPPAAPAPAEPASGEFPEMTPEEKLQADIAYCFDILGTPEPEQEAMRSLFRGSERELQQRLNVQIDKKLNQYAPEAGEEQPKSSPASGAALERKGSFSTGGGAF